MQCDECNEAQAAVMCNSCALRLCGPCDKFLHMSAQLGMHNRLDLNFTPKPSSEGAKRGARIHRTKPCMILSGNDLAEIEEILKELDDLRTETEPVLSDSESDTGYTDTELESENESDEDLEEVQIS